MIVIYIYIYMFCFFSCKTKDYNQETFFLFFVYRVIIVMERREKKACLFIFILIDLLNKATLDFFDRQR